MAKALRKIRQSEFGKPDKDTKEEHYKEQSNSLVLLKGHHNDVGNKSSADELDMGQPYFTALFESRDGNVRNVRNIGKLDAKSEETRSRIERNDSNARKSGEKSKEKRGSKEQQSSLRRERQLPRQQHSHRATYTMPNTDDVMSWLGAQSAAFWWMAGGLFLLCCCSCCCLTESYLRRKDQLSRRDRMRSADEFTYTERVEAKSWFDGILSKGKRARGVSGTTHYKFGDITRGFFS